MKFIYNFSVISLVVVLLTSIYSITSLSDHTAFAGCTRTTPAGSFADDDCDGLANLWETSKFYDENGNGIGVTLPASVKVDRKDILVEIDTMTDHENLAAAIDLVKNKFNVAPVANPNPNTPGINLVVILDDRNITHASCTSIWSGFQAIKNSKFGTLSERAANPNIVSEKEDIFHYGVALHSQCGATGSSGMGELKGNDFLLSLGVAGWGDSDGDGHPDGNTYQQAATFMHELGHNLNLKHGGSTNTPTCKPNYFSVMNQLYQFSGIVPAALIDYSNTFGRDKLGHLLDEINGLHEPDGIVGPTSPAYRGAIGTISGIKLFWSDGSGIDYNFDGDILDNVLNRAINYFPTYAPPCPSTSAPDGVSFGFKDWPNLMYWDPPEAKELLNQIQLQTTGPGISYGSLVSQDNNASNFTSNQTGNLGDSLLDDPSLPPCDVTDPICTYTPCDQDDPNCIFKPITNVTGPTNQTEDIGNRTALIEVSIEDIKNVSISKIVQLDSLIQNASFINSTTITSLHKELITDPESVVAQIQSNSYYSALVKLLKLRSLIEIIPINSNEFAARNEIIYLIDDATNQLKNML